MAEAHLDIEKITNKSDSKTGWRLLATLKPYWKLVVVASILSLLLAFTALAGPKIIQVAIDEHITVGDSQGVIRLSIYYFIIVIISFCLEYAREWLTSYVGQQAMFDLRKKIFAHIQKLSLSFTDRNPVGALMTRVTNDVASLNELFSQGFTTIAGDLFLLVAIAAILIYKNWILALLVFSTIPLLLLASWWFRRTVRTGFRMVRLKLSQMNTYLQENLSGMRTVQAYNREAVNFKQFHTLNEEYRAANITTIFAYAVFIPAVEIISAISLAAIIWYGGIASIDDTITVGTIVLFIQYCQRFFQPIKDLSDKFNLLQNAMASGERIFKLLDEKPAILPPENPVPYKKINHSIKFENVWFAYKDEDWVLKDVSFEVKKGQTVALVGATGSGKTTIISLLSRFYDIQKGSIRIDGIDIREFSPQDLRQKMAIVLQDNFLFSGDIAGNIRLGNEEISDDEIVRAARYVNAEGFINSLPNRYGQEVLERGATFSVGQKQLLAFARALAFNPEILILDEATASIDTETELLIQDALEKLLVGRTSIVIAHRLSTIQNADNIIVLHHGCLKEQGTHAELLNKNGLYRNLFELQYSHVKKIAAETSGEL